MAIVNNDDRILELKKQIEEKKTKLGKTLRFTPVTNCMVDLDGVKHNLNVLPKDQLIAILVKLNAYSKSAKELVELGVVNEQYVISGYTTDEWIADIKSKINILVRKEEERTLTMMEEKLSKLLSDGKKVELELDEIASHLKS